MNLISKILGISTVANEAPSHRKSDRLRFRPLGEGLETRLALSQTTVPPPDPNVAMVLTDTTNSQTPVTINPNATMALTDTTNSQTPVTIDPNAAMALTDTTNSQTPVTIDPNAAMALMDTTNSQPPVTIDPNSEVDDATFSVDLTDVETTDPGEPGDQIDIVDQTNIDVDDLPITTPAPPIQISGS